MHPLVMSPYSRDVTTHVLITIVNFKATISLKVSARVPFNNTEIMGYLPICMYAYTHMYMDVCIN